MPTATNQDEQSQDLSLRVGFLMFTDANAPILRHTSAREELNYCIHKVFCMSSSQGGHLFQACGQSQCGNLRELAFRPSHPHSDDDQLHLTFI